MEEKQLKLVTLDFLCHLNMYKINNNSALLIFIFNLCKCFKINLVAIEIGHSLFYLLFKYVLGCR